MTPGLLVSKNHKGRLHKKALTHPTENNIAKYKSYRNLYNSTVKKSKKMYFTDNLKRFEKNPKKRGIFLEKQ